LNNYNEKHKIESPILEDKELHKKHKSLKERHETVELNIDPSKTFNQDSVLLKWVQAHLKKSDCPKQINNLGADLSDSVGLIYLLN